MSGEGTIEQVLAGEALWNVTCADCLDVLPTLADKSVDAVVTDPPYGVGFAEWDSLCAPALGEMMRVSERVAVTPGVRNLFQWPAPAWVASWSYPAGFKRSDCGGFNAWEPVLLYGSASMPLDSRQFPPVASEKIEHDCPKPLAAWTWLVRSTTEPGHAILDPFAGSGTTGVAALRLGRSVILIEREPKWAELCRERMRAEEQSSTLQARKAGQVAMFGGEK